MFLMPNVLVLWQVASDQLYYIVAQAFKFSLYARLFWGEPRKHSLQSFLLHP